MRKFFILAIVTMLLGAGCTNKFDAPVPVPKPNPVVCTADAKICPDGTGVGRVGPNCEFAPCPSAKPTPNYIYQPQTINDLTIQPLEVLSDSRCPADVQCVWAGTVTLKVKLVRYVLTDTTTLTLGTPVKFNAQIVTLTEVTPAKTSQTKIAPGDYRFTFTVTEENTK